MNKIIGLVFLVSFSPLFLLVAIIVLLSDGFPVLFRQKRIGINNLEFQIFKFRTMKNNTPDIATHQFINSKDYFIRFGLFLRKYSLDELPQIINIINGTLNFIGPRPALYNQKDLIAMRTEKKIHKIPPGITGWAQVNGRDNLDIIEKVEMDYFYMLNKSFLLDFKIIFLTIYNVIKAKNIKN